MADRLTATRCLTASETLAHAATAVHMATALGPEIAAVAAGRRLWAEGQHQHAGMSAAAHDEVHPLPDDREADR